MTSRAISALILLSITTTLASAAEPVKPFNTQKPGAEFLDPEVSRKAFQLPEGFLLSVFAAEPDVHQPIAMATDERGRLWVVENYTYAEREVGFETSLRDRIVIFEDTNHDGKHDKRTIFWDQGSKLTSVEVGFGGVWVLAAPQMLFIPDRNKDDKPDSEPIVLLDGWNDDDIRHNIVNGLRWGPDGWLYGRHGIKSSSWVGQPGDALEERTKLNCAIWRYHPTRKTFEVVAQGGTNSWGMDWDQHGQMFFINTVIGHLWHVIPGARYERMFGEHFSPYVYDLIDQTADHIHWDTTEKWSDLKQTGLSNTTDKAGGGHAHCGMMIYLGNNWPEKYRGGVFTVNLHGLRINHDSLKRKGATYTAEHQPDMIRTDDPWFRGVELLYGPDGGVYIADWSDIGECHENDGVHRTSGRIYKVTYQPQQKSSLTKPFDLSRLSNSGLVYLQNHQNEWYARQSRRLLQERAVAGTDVSDAKEKLLKLFRSANKITTKLRALWCLHSIGALDEKWLLQQLSHQEEHVRVWAIQLLCEAQLPSDEVITQLTQLAKTESSGLVQTFLASALRRFPAERKFALAANLSAHTEFANDPVLPKMIWYGVMPASASLPKKSIELARHSQAPLVRRNIARRLTSEIRTNPGAVDALVKLLAESHSNAFRHDILEGMTLALRGWRKADAPAGWDQVSNTLLTTNDLHIVEHTRELAVIFGDGQAIDELLKIVASSNHSLSERKNTIRSLAGSRVKEVVPLLQNLLNNRDLGPEAIQGLSAFDDPKTPELIVKNYGALYRRSRGDAVGALASRPAYAAVLLDAVKKGSIPKEDVSAFHLRQMQSLDDAIVSKLVRDLWPEFEQTAGDKAKQIAEYQKTLTPNYLKNANLSAGRGLFQKSCAACHRLFGTGGDVGPDLTGAQRQNLYYLLENIVTPSATLPKNYRMSIIITQDGRVLNGIVIQKNQATLTLQTPKDRITLPREDIEEMKESKLSLMPEQQLDVLTKEQVRDLIGYLMSKTQVKLPPGFQSEGE